MVEANTTEWVDNFVGLSRLKGEPRRRLLEGSRIERFKKGTVLFGPDRSPQNMLFLLDGTVRVQQVSENGREIVLYRINAGESCVLTTACLLTFDHYSAEGVAETDIEAAAMPRGVFDDLIATSPEFRNFVFSAFSKRITDMFLMIDEVAFQKIDARLAQRLLLLSPGGSKIAATHQKLAVELGTAREVVSRQLQEFQRRGWVELSRGTVTILDRAALESLADGS